MTKKQEQLVQNLCEKLERQYEQNTELNIKLQAIFNLLLRFMDSVTDDN